MTNETLDEILAGIPNLPADDTPTGAGEDDNVPVPARAFGSNPGLNNAKEHFDLGEALGMMDFERAARVSGASLAHSPRGLARLERALGNFMIDLHTEIFGYTEVNPPVLVRDNAMIGTGQLPKFEEDLFEFSSARASAINDLELSIRGLVETFSDREQLKKSVQAHFTDSYIAARANRMWLIPTAEVSLNYVNGEILDEDKLPHCRNCKRMLPELKLVRRVKTRADDPDASVLEGGTGVDHHAGAIHKRA